jgi:hypothetical protein
MLLSGSRRCSADVGRRRKRNGIRLARVKRVKGLRCRGSLSHTSSPLDVSIRPRPTAGSDAPRRTLPALVARPSRPSTTAHPSRCTASSLPTNTLPPRPDSDPPSTRRHPVFVPFSLPHLAHHLLPIYRSLTRPSQSSLRLLTLTFRNRRIER